jgi:hypothetical protein
VWNAVRVTQILKIFSRKGLGWLQGCDDYIYKCEIRWLNGEVDYRNNDGCKWAVRNYQGDIRTDFG